MDGGDEVMTVEVIKGRVGLVEVGECVLERVNGTDNNERIGGLYT